MAAPISELDCLRCRHRREPQDIEAFIEPLRAAQKQPLIQLWKATTDRQRNNESMAKHVPDLPRHESWCSYYSRPGGDRQSYQRVEYAICKHIWRDCEVLSPFDSAEGNRRQDATGRGP